MAGIAQGNQPRMSVESFRRFLESRPEKERWELIDGVAVRLERPTLGHQRVASNRIEARVDLRTDASWKEQTLRKAEDLLALSDFGLRCKLSDLYRGTAPQPP
jgi:hypothetical protein